jgi:hypothetical protein
VPEVPGLPLDPNDPLGGILGGGGNGGGGGGGNGGGGGGGNGGGGGGGGVLPDLPGGLGRAPVGQPSGVDADRVRSISDLAAMLTWGVSAR